MSSRHLRTPLLAPPHMCWGGTADCLFFIVCTNFTGVSSGFVAVKDSVHIQPQLCMCRALAHDSISTNVNKTCGEIKLD